jgi:hypothetical protein
VPPIYEDLNSLQCECFGILVSIKILTLIQLYIKVMNSTIIPHQITIYFDNRSAVQTITETRYRKITTKQQLAPNIDIIRSIIHEFHKV